ncbi:MAG: NAD(P)/FAD-dependent oxidoreductase [Acidimicrobiia bacterium]|nr:NAD(P)/FAD-dependent oxidoreductase [Acidimicrobiia bacterium]
MASLINGTAPSTEDADGRPAAETDVDVVVVGAGFAGMYLLHLLRGHGFSTQVLERGAGVGGTWYWNRYPGARCDVRSIDYSYSFDPDLEQEWEWSEKFATQPEILRYANHVADRFDLRRDIRFETGVEVAQWDEAGRRWRITTDDGTEVTARFYIMATGCLSSSKRPEVDGIDDFRGDTYHTGHWPHEGVDFTGQRVAVIGTGSSGIQSIPLIAEQAEHLTVFQRTPNFSLPSRNGLPDPDELAAIKADYPAYRDLARQSFGGAPRPLPTKGALDVGDDERRAVYQSAWDEGGLGGILASFTDLRTSQEANDTAAEFIREQIRSIVDDPEVAEILCPHDHPFGTKRPCLDTNYYATYNRSNVDLVNLRATPLVRLTESGIVTSERHYEFDAIVFATGFDAMTGAICNVDIRGVGGLELRKKWEDGPRTYLGLMVAGFPNLFTVTGPGSPSVLSNMMVSIEQHAEWITGCVVHLRGEGARAIEATVEAEDDWVEHVREVGDATLYPKANSWYMGANVPGKPRVFLPYVGGVGPYRRICDEIVADGYRGFALSH